MAEPVEKNLIPKKEELEKKEEKKELTPKERYVLDYTPEGKTLKFLMEHPDFSLSQLSKVKGVRGRSRVPDLVIIGKLEKLDVVEIKNDLMITKINLENFDFEKLWEEAEEGRAAKILKLVEEKEFITVRQIAKMLKDWSYSVIRKEVNKLESARLVTSIRWKGGRKGGRIVFSPSCLLEKIKTGELEKATTRKAEEIIKKTDEEIKAKETKEK